MTTKELLAQLNAQREAQGKPPLAAWKQSREKLEQAIAETAPQEAPEEVRDEITAEDADAMARFAEGDDTALDRFEMPESELVRLPVDGPEPLPDLGVRLLRHLPFTLATVSCYDILLAAGLPDAYYLQATEVLKGMEVDGMVRSHIHDGECDWGLTEQGRDQAVAAGRPSDLSDPEVGQRSDEEVLRAEGMDAEGRTQQAEEVRPPRGAVKQMVNSMLETDAPYEDIVKAVREAHPTAKTTARSIASMAMDLRRLGVTIPSRRKVGAVG